MEDTVNASALERFLRRFGASGSLRSRIRTMYTSLVALMLIPILIALSLMMFFGSRYHAILTHIEGISSLEPMVRDELLSSLLDVVVGRTRFEDGVSLRALNSIETHLDSLIGNNAESSGDLMVARRVLVTLGGYVDEMGVQIANRATVDETFRINEEIKNVASLFLEMLNTAINTEIRASAEVSGRMQTTLFATLALAIAVLVAALVFAALTQTSLTRSIRAPLARLEGFAGQIAHGEFGGRTPAPDVEELTGLTESLNTMAFNLQLLVDENAREQDNLMKSELRTLQAQITPHFLYNTLDAIIWLAESGETAQVISVTHALSSFFRTTLAGGREWISIREEKEHLEGYMTIQRVRYRDILKFSLECDTELENLQILKLLIQPLVENAIYHGIKNKRGGGLVAVELHKDDERLHVSVKDTGAGIPKDTLDTLRSGLASGILPTGDKGFGLYSVDKRIKLYYRQKNGLTLESLQGEGTCVTFDVPL
ncbi:MAG: sensor histidine kinase [Oscillospiraceae bacterium]|jgi:two-component system sensor histidine kinase YesM|nr:sensor histidine kinase [Oscillospiraceae bacterium]